MLLRNFTYVDWSWIDAGLNQAYKSQELICSLLSKRARLQDKLRRVKLELDQQLPPTPQTVGVTCAQMGVLPCFPFSEESSFQPSILPIVTEAIEDWQRLYESFLIRKEHLRETVRVLRRRSRRLSHVVGLLLRALTCPLFL